MQVLEVPTQGGGSIKLRVEEGFLLPPEDGQFQFPGGQPSLDLFEASNGDVNIAVDLVLNLVSG